ncbi:MAG: SCO family protein [Candidatus Limnocylindria bacterium]|nr:SCO family protein [Candidatus Limnocylindria bacterium]
MLALALALALATGACAAPAPVAGTDLGGGPAPDFALQDALTGQSLALASLRGRAVVLTFLYTQCPDSCPLTAELLRVAQNGLGTDAARVELVAVSTDPDRDTPAAERAFTDAHRLTTSWHYLIGRREQLAPVWSAYGVRAEPDQGATTVTHSDVLFLIDPMGRERYLLHTDAGPDALVNTLRVILQ